MSNVAVAGSYAQGTDLEAIRATLTELREQQVAWESEVAMLFDDFDSLAVQMAVQSAAYESDESAMKQLASMREMLVQQTELLAGFLNAAGRDNQVLPTACDTDREFSERRELLQVSSRRKSLDVEAHSATMELTHSPT